MFLAFRILVLMVVILIGEIVKIIFDAIASCEIRKMVKTQEDSRPTQKPSIAIISRPNFDVIRDPIREEDQINVLP